MKIKLIRNKKGVSSVFVAIYLAMLAVLLVSVLFTALNIYGTSITERMKMEEERQQEGIRLAGPEALNLTDTGGYFHFLRVNNTGTITLRIRALYVGHRFIFDPSVNPITLEKMDSYIKPKGFLWIQLYPLVKIVLNSSTMDATWTVTSERGTKSHATTQELIWGLPESHAGRLTIGPLMIIFDMFHWKSGTGPWINGWSIPKSTNDVTWRILIVNIDNRDILVTDKSSLTLISNDNSPSAPVAWYIDPLLSFADPTKNSTIYKPGSFYFVYYSWPTPYFDIQGTPKKQSLTAFKESTTCITFLMFIGAFIEPNGTSTSYGQTIPFEAVLVTSETMPSSLKLEANPRNIIDNGVSISTITATVKDAKGAPVASTWIDFYTTSGTLNATHATTNAQGVATVILRSTTSKTTAFITALCQGVEGTTKVGFTPATHIGVSANPTQIPRDKGISTITMWLFDASNNINVTQAGVPMTVTVVDNSGNIPSGKTAPILIYGDQQGQQLTVTTNSNGQVILTFQTRSMNKPWFKVTADDGPNGLQGGEATITIG